MKRLKKYLLTTSFIFQSIVMTYLIYIYPVLTFIFKFNAIPNSWWSVFILCALGLYFTVRAFEEDYYLLDDD